MSDEVAPEEHGAGTHIASKTTTTVTKQRVCAKKDPETGELVIMPPEACKQNDATPTEPPSGGDEPQEDQPPVEEQPKQEKPKEEETPSDEEPSEPVEEQ